MARNQRIIGIEIEKIDTQILGELIDKVSREAERILQEKLPPKTEYDLTVKIEKMRDSINFVIDVGVRGKYPGITDYNLIIGDAINSARRVLEDELRKISRGGGEATGAKGEKGINSHT